MTYEELQTVVEEELRRILHHAGAELEIIPEFGDDGVSTYAQELLGVIAETGIKFTEEVK